MPEQDRQSELLSKEHHLNLVPIPDPTILTTQNLLREISALTKLFEVRFGGYDKAIELLQRNADKLPSVGELSIKIHEQFERIQQQFLERDKTAAIFREFISQQPETIQSIVNRLRELHDEKFHTIDTQFRERDVRIETALASAKEAVAEQNRFNGQAINKSEATFTKQLEALGTLIAATATALTGKIDDIKERIANIEKGATGMAQHSKGLSDGWGYIVGAIGALVGIVGGIAAAFAVARAFAR